MKFKLISDLMKRIAVETGDKVSVTYPGKSVSQQWTNGEVIVHSEIETRTTNAAAVISLATVVVFTSGDVDLDERVCKRILEANPDMRLIFVTEHEDRRFNPEHFLLFRDRMFSISFEHHPKDTALTILALARTPMFQIDSIRSCFMLRLNQIGFVDLVQRGPQTLQFVETALQPPDRETRELHGGWTCFVFKTFLPTVRDLSDFRGILLKGRILNHDFLVYKESIQTAVNFDIERSASLIKSFSPPR